ncbi:MAG: BrnA antitoxin family protein [Sphingobium sp.]|nr:MULTISPECIES: BrnA antitoxin family protein [unclassified Sphingobium]MBJ7375768.1 BrnA antitoxin family protein [Sphingobium sp.]
MMKNAKSTGASWSDPDDAPKLAQDWANGADAYRGKALIRRGRPTLAQTKQHVSLRLDPDVIESFKADGPGWQGRINEALRKAAGL